MGEIQIRHPFSLFSTAASSSSAAVDITRRSTYSSTAAFYSAPSFLSLAEVLIKDLAAVYHAECLTYCQELLELQSKLEDPFRDVKSQEDSRKEMTKTPKRLKKLR
ncbi:hypothetical protein Adt_43255 [Abeliophyllum distichum]|uniref:Uncharacterized protein n=1 Tax=Abeliophyllum distichum TaxID=126358 RepID=A0ABD1PTZ0_9LAMI